MESGGTKEAASITAWCVSVYFGCAATQLIVVSALQCSTPCPAVGILLGLQFMNLHQDQLSYGKAAAVGEICIALSHCVLTLGLPLLLPAGIVSRYTKEPDVIGMHGGLPPSNTFPFTWFHTGLLPLGNSSSAAVEGKADASEDVLNIEDPQLVSVAQQYNMQAQVRIV